MKTVDGFKWCPGCKQYKDTLIHFGKDGSREDGLQAYCKTCRSAKYKANSDFEPETVFYANTDHPSRGSVPHTEREAFDNLISIGGIVWIETPAGNRIAWEDID